MRQVLKMIEQREKALQARAPKVVHQSTPMKISYATTMQTRRCCCSASSATTPTVNGEGPRPLLVERWAAQVRAEPSGTASIG